jgi:pimeloyl-ACP methyl ester carboxylesterase
MRIATQAPYRPTIEHRRRMNPGFPHTRQPAAAWRDIMFTVRDGLRLSARHYPAIGGPLPNDQRRRPVVCLAGTTQNSQAFDDLAMVLSQAGTLARDVYTLDYRGRGRSDHDSDWRNYTPYFEMLDVLDFFAMERLHDAALVGTSRGGIIAMIMGAVRPAAIGAVVLNDIGPTIEASGWMRQMGRVGRIPIPKSWDEAARYVRELEKDDHPRLTEGQWSRLARQRYFERNGVPAPSYDASISRAFSLNSISSGVPSLWPQFRSLCRVPLLSLRGEISDVLSEKTVGEMESVHPRMRSVVVPGQGHAPLLSDELSTDAILLFLAEADGRSEQDRAVLAAYRGIEPAPAPAALLRAAGA